MSPLKTNKRTTGPKSPKPRKPVLSALPEREPEEDVEGIEATLRFRLPRDRRELLLALSADKLLSVFTELDNALRASVKYGSPFNGVSMADTSAPKEPDMLGLMGPPTDGDKAELLDAVRGFMREALTGRGITLEDLEGC